MRSSDLGVNWVDLTEKADDGLISPTYIQIEDNSGLIYPCYNEGEPALASHVTKCKERHNNGENLTLLEQLVLQIIQLSMLRV